MTLDFRGCLIVSGDIFFFIATRGWPVPQRQGVWVWGPFVCQWALQLSLTVNESLWKCWGSGGATPSSTQTGLGLFSGSAARINWAKDDVKFNHSLEKCWIKEANRVNYQTRFSHQKPERLSLEDPGEQGRAGGGSEQQSLCSRGHALLGGWNLGRESCSRTFAF